MFGLRSSRRLDNVSEPIISKEKDVPVHDALPLTKICTPRTNLQSEESKPDKKKSEIVEKKEIEEIPCIHKPLISTCIPRRTDPPLRNWKKWLKNREEMIAYLSLKTKRKPEELLFNSFEEFRELRQEKLMLYHANTWKDFKVEDIPPPKIELISTSEKIQNEKHILPRARNMFIKWQNNSYRIQKMNELACIMEKIQPHCPDYKNLIVVGRGKAEKNESSLNVQSKKINAKSKQILDDSKTEKTQLNTKSKIDHQKEEKIKLQLEIDNMVLNNTICKPREKKKLRVIFEYNILSEKIFYKKVIFTNTGRATLRIYFKKLEKFKLFSKYLDDRSNDYYFYFNYDEMLLIPGETVELFIYHKSKKPGVYSENWEIFTKPKTWDPSFQFIMHIYSYAYYPHLYEKNRKILKDIEYKCKVDAIKEVLEYICQSFKYENKEVVDGAFDKKRMFESRNLVYGYPRYMYSETIVGDLCSFYDSIKTLKSPNDWNFSITLLMKMAEEYDIFEYLETTRFRLPVILKPIAQVFLPAQPFIPIERAQFCFKSRDTLKGLLYKLEMILRYNEDREKLFHCTNIFIDYFDLMLEKLEQLEFALEIYFINYPSPPQCISEKMTKPFERFLYEFDGVFSMEKTLTLEGIDIRPEPKTKVLDGIPQDDYARIYLTYFNKPVTALDRKLNRGKKEAPAKPRPKPPPTGAEPFDAYSEKFHFVPLINTVASDEFDEDEEGSRFPFIDFPDGKVKQIYCTQQYIIIYSMLGAAVEAMVDEVESLKGKLPSSVINQLKKLYK